MTVPGEPSIDTVVGERKLVTMLFADLAGYTALSETLDPEEVYTFLRPTLDQLVGIATSFGATVPQIEGDGFMAVFGVPVAHEDDAERAVRAAVAMRAHLDAANRDRRGMALPQMHAGVRSGEVLVAPSTERAGFAVIGDTVNTASRLCSLAKAGEILVGDSTYALTARAIRYGPRRRLRAKGKAEPLETYLVLDVGPAPFVPTRPTFVDREEILGRLGSELELVESEGRSRVLVVTGEPGIGKSRLAVELAHSLGDGRLFVGRCSPFADQGRLGPLAEIAGAALGIEPGVATHAALAQAARRVAGAEDRPLTADLTVLLGAATAARDAARTDRDLVRSVRRVLEWSAAEATAVAVVDDLQWADPVVVGLLEEAVDAPWPARIVLLGLSRERIRGLPAVPLPALDETSMDALTEALLGSPGTADAIRSPVARANGNPLFLEEMVGMLVERGAVTREDERWTLADPGALDDVPATIRLVLAARLDALPPAEKAVLTDAAVCGTVAWDAALGRLRDPAVVASALDGLVARGLLVQRAHSAIPKTRAFEWRHALIRDVAYRALPRAARADRHEAIAAWLREASPGGGELVVAIAFQYEQAWELRHARTGAGPSPELTRSAGEFLTQRGEQLYSRQARAAEPAFRRALAVLGDERTTLDIQGRAAVGLAEVLIEMGRHEEAIAQARRARSIAGRVRDDSLAARALLALGRSESDAGSTQRARRLLLQARARFETLGDLRGQGWAWHRLSETWGWQGFDRELEDLENAFACFSRARDAFGRSIAANDLAYILSVQGGREFHRWYRQAERLVADEGDVRSRASLLRTWGSYCYAAGLHGDAIATMARCRPVAVDAGDRYTEADAVVMGALAVAASGDPAQAIEMAREGVEHGRQLGSVRIPAMARLALARAAIRSGDRRASSAALRAARVSILDRGLRVMHSDLAETQAMLALDRGAWSDAVAAADELERSLRAVPAALWTPLPALIRGRAQLARGAVTPAAASLREAAALARRVGASGTQDLARAALGQTRALRGSAARAKDDEAPATAEIAAILAENRGIAAWLRGDVHEAAYEFDEAVERWSSMGSTAWLARAHRMRAEALRSVGDRARAAAADAAATAASDAVGTPARERPTLDRPLPEPGVGSRGSMGPPRR